MKTVISQPRYLPALNYLQRLYFADKFVILDVVQRQSRGWENRNKLLLPEPSWLTVPVSSSSRSLIFDTLIDGRDWLADHKKRVCQHYSKAPFFSEQLLDEAFSLNEDSNRYVDVLVALMKNACRLLSFEPKFIFASDLLVPDEFTQGGVEVLRLISERVKADIYVSGPNGRKYGVVEGFLGSGTGVLFHDFKHPQYEQLNHPFVPYMGYLDALFYCGVKWLSCVIRTTPNLRGCRD